ncbi:hypothetical protein MCEMSE6_02485 [Oxalobacteraceae bacterium]
MNFENSEFNAALPCYVDQYSLAIPESNFASKTVRYSNLKQDRL